MCGGEERGPFVKRPCAAARRVPGAPSCSIWGERLPSDPENSRVFSDFIGVFAIFSNLCWVGTR